MRGPNPKDPALRQRRNKASTRATLTIAGEERTQAPRLPKREEGKPWHALTRAWWRDVWHSPMSREYLDADIHGLYRLAALVERFWTAPSETLDARICAQEQRFGLSPLDRRRLEWIVERAETEKKRRPLPTKAADDPRKLFSVV